MLTLPTQRTLPTHETRFSQEPGPKPRARSERIVESLGEESRRQRHLAALSETILEAGRAGRNDAAVSTGRAVRTELQAPSQGIVSSESISQILSCVTEVLICCSF